MKNSTSSMLICAVASAVIGALFGALVSTIIYSFPKSQEQMIKDFYYTDNAVYVSPHGIRKKMAKGETDGFLLVDLRSPEEYEREHIAGALSVWAYKDPDTSAYDEVDRIVEMFKALPQNKEIIVYCYSMPCMTGRKVGKMLAENSIYVKHLGIGWNEWRYFWNLWNHEQEWNRTNVEDYVVSGSEPGEAIPDPNYISPCIEGQFDC